MGWNWLSIPKVQQCNCWSLGMTVAWMICTLGGDHWKATIKALNTELDSVLLSTYNNLGWFFLLSLIIASNMGNINYQIYIYCYLYGTSSLYCCPWYWFLPYHPAPPHHHHNHTIHQGVYENKVSNLANIRFFRGGLPPIMIYLVRTAQQHPKLLIKLPLSQLYITTSDIAVGLRSDRWVSHGLVVWVGKKLLLNEFWYCNIIV